jgi:hypothetical protein
MVRKNWTSSSTTNCTKLRILYRWQNHYATKMPYQSKNCVIHGYKFTDGYHDDDAFDLSHWDNNDDSIVYLIPTIKDENELNIFLIAPYPPSLIGRYDYCAMPDKEYDLMIDKLRKQILKASPHARIRHQIRINKIDKRNQRLASYVMHLHHQTYLTM